jgi:hypothetical protein
VRVDFRFLVLRLLFLGGVFILTSYQLKFLQVRPVYEYIAPSPLLQHIHFGFKYFMSDLLWLRGIQDLDYCETKDTQHICVGKVWLFEVLNLSTLLDPWYHQVYSSGAIGLSVIISDIKGAGILFDRAVKYYPYDWRLLYKAAYHAIYEEKNKLKGARLLEQSARYGAPDWVFALASRVYSEQGQKELVRRILEDAKSLGISESILAEIKKRLTP